MVSETEICTEYTGFEMMLVSACRQIKNDDIVFNAFHWPFLAVHMAKLLHCPDLFAVLEVGQFQNELPRPIKMPYSISDPAMVDKYGNCNTTVVGPYEKPIYRLPGGGGATEIAGMAKRLVWLIDDHTKRRLPEKLDFITDPGYLDGFNSRIKAGYPPDTGPDVIVTPFCIMKFDPESKEAYLDALHPNISIEQVKENTGWDLKIAKEVKQIDPPTLKEIDVCRQTMRDAIDQYFLLKPEWTTYL
jgi:glutaconate CoA-transferase subunit B